jgi:hypothetical protein
MTIADLAQQVQNLPSQLLADLILGVPLTLFVLLVLLSASARHGRRTWR